MIPKTQGVDYRAARAAKVARATAPVGVSANEDETSHGLLVQHCSVAGLGVGLLSAVGANHSLPVPMQGFPPSLCNAAAAASSSFFRCKLFQ